MTAALYGMDQPAPLTAALLGVEHPHSLAHLRTLQQLPEVERILLWDESAEALARVAAEQGDKVALTTTDLDVLLADAHLTCVIAAIRNDLGPDIFLRTIAAGKHLMAEKPIGRTAADTERVIDAAAKAGVQLGVCYQNRANAVVEEARRLVSLGVIGPLMSLEMRMITTQVRFRRPEHWLFSYAKAGGGILSWLGCHYIDLMRYITQDEIVAVQAEVATRSGEAIDVEDVAALSLRFRSGAVGTLHAGYILALSGSGYHNPAGYDTYVGLNGRGGRIHWQSNSSPYRLQVESALPGWAGAPRWEAEYTHGTSPAYGGKSGEAFIRRFILSTQQPAVTAWTRGEDALAVARIVDAAYESSRTGRRIEITPLSSHV